MSPLIQGELFIPPYTAFFAAFSPFNPDMAIVRFQQSYSLDYIKIISGFFQLTD